MIKLFAMLSLMSGLFLFEKMQAQQIPASIYEFKVTAIDGKEFDFSKLKGKKIMIVNTASKCGLTKQYVELEELYKKYGPDKFVIVGFPANDFNSQEPGSNEEIQNFCRINYGVSFPMMSKISVKGENIHPLYVWLTNKKYNRKEDSEVKWNFQKYLIDEKGHLAKVIAPKTKPSDPEVVEWISK